MARVKCTDVAVKRPGFVKGIDYFCSCVVKFFFKLIVELCVAIQSVLLFSRVNYVLKFSFFGFLQLLQLRVGLLVVL